MQQLILLQKKKIYENSNSKKCQQHFVAFCHSNQFSKIKPSSRWTRLNELRCPRHRTSKGTFQKIILLAVSVKLQHQINTFPLSCHLPTIFTPTHSLHLLTSTSTSFLTPSESSHLSPFGWKTLWLLSRLPPAAVREQWAARRPRHQSGGAAGRTAAVAAVMVGGSSGGGSGSLGRGRLAQEDVEQLEQRRQDHGPRQRLTAADSGSGRPPRGPVAA